MFVITVSIETMMNVAKATIVANVKNSSMGVHFLSIGLRASTYSY